MVERVLIQADPVRSPTAVIAAGVTGNQDGKDDRAVIRNVMQKAMKGGIAAKFAKGEASADERAQLITLFTSLTGTKAPKGDAKSWNEKTSALLAAVSANDRNAFTKASNCAACHKEHKGGLAPGKN